MKIKYSVITGFLGRLQDRFTSYQTERKLEEKIKLASTIDNAEGVELVYPEDFENPSITKNLLDEYQLSASAVNVNLKSESRWARGSLCSPFPEIQREAIESLRKAMDLALDLKCNLITVAFLNDGHDYPFQLNYLHAWESLVGGIREATDYQPTVKLGLEYKLSEPTAYGILGTVGKALYLCEKVDRDNIGITMDVGHSLCAGENASESVSLLSSAERLFYLHFNDNYRNWDWDLIPGVVNLWNYLELFFYLREYNYTGWVALDVFPKSLDPLETFNVSIQFMRNLERISKKIDPSVIFPLIKEGKVPKIFAYLQEISLKLD
jgi:xylose isomerase